MSITTGHPESFRRMDESTAEQWAVIGAEVMGNQPRVADRVLGLLESLADITDGFITDQLTYCLQTATLAERSCADDESVGARPGHAAGDWTPPTPRSRSATPISTATRSSKTRISRSSSSRTTSSTAPIRPCPRAARRT